VSELTLFSRKRTDWLPVLRLIPSVIGIGHQNPSGATLQQMEQQILIRAFAIELPRKTSRFEMGAFTGSAHWLEHSDLETEILQEITESGNGLAFSRATATYFYFDTRTWEYANFTKTTYKFSSSRNHGYMLCQFWPFRCGHMCKIVIIVVEPEYQGSFFNFKDFMGRIASTLFALKKHPVYYLFGNALSNPYPVRTPTDWRMQKTKDDEYKIVRLYQKLGFVRIPASENNSMCLYSDGALELLEAEDPNAAKLVKTALEMHGRKRFKQGKQ
jgi:hypothetical protein